VPKKQSNVNLHMAGMMEDAGRNRKKQEKQEKAPEHSKRIG